MSVASREVMPVCAASTVMVRSNGSPSLPVDVSVKLVVTPEPMIFSSLALLIVTSVPSSSSSWKLLMLPALLSTYALTDCCVGIRVALSDDMSSSSTNAVIVIEPSAKLPNVIVPVVVMALDPLSIAPNPLVMLPLFIAPVVTMLELPAAGAAAISDNTSDAERPSIDVPSIRRKSLSAAPLVNTGRLPLDIPVDRVATVVIAVPSSVIASASRVPSKSPSTASMLPLNTVDVIVPVLGL